MEREAEATKHLQAALLKRLKETEAQQDLQVPDARVIAYPTPPNTPSYPRPTLTLVAALFGSLLVGVVAALVRENLA